MTPLRVGQLVRAARHHIGLPQRDVAARAGVAISTVSRIERGDLRFVRWPQLERVCAVVEVRIDLAATWRGAGGALLLDRDHAAIVELVVRMLSDAGWVTEVEFGFNHYGDRGSVDVLAWHEASRSLRIVEVKTVIVDVQDLLSSLARKVRVVPSLAASDRGWKAVTVSQVLVARGSRAVRDAINRHRATFETAMPDRTVAARQWLRQPVGRLSGVMFVAETRLQTVTQKRSRLRPRRVPRTAGSVQERTS